MEQRPILGSRSLCFYSSLCCRAFSSLYFHSDITQRRPVSDIAQTVTGEHIHPRQPPVPEWGSDGAPLHSLAD